MKKLIAIALIMATFVACNNEKTSNSKTTPSGTISEKVKISTDYGDIIIGLYDETPKHRDNFLKLVDEGFYDSLLFHRVIKSFMIQGGDPESKNAAADAPLGNGGPGYTIPAEIVPGLFHKKGALAAARQGDQMNPLRASSGSQFYIVQGSVLDSATMEMMTERMVQDRKGQIAREMMMDSTHKELFSKLQEFGSKGMREEYNKLVQEKLIPLVENAYAKEEPIKFSEKQYETYTTLGGTPHLDNAYTVFGEVIEGLNVVDSIAATTTGAQDRPKKDLRMFMKRIK